MPHPKALAHGRIESLFEDLWYVQGAMKMPIAIPMRLSRTMTILRDKASGELTLINSMRLDDAGLGELEGLGKIARVVRIAGFHGRDDAFYRDTYGAKVYAIEGQAYERSMKADTAPTEGYMQPDVWLRHGDTLPVHGASLHVTKTASPPEGLVLLDIEGGTLVSGDALQNMSSPDEFTNWPARILMRLMGFFRPHNVGPGWLKAASPSAEDLQELLELDFQNVVPAHGDPVVGDAASKYRKAIESAVARSK